MTNLPTIELEDDQDNDYMVLCYDGQRLDLEEFIYQPQNLYQLTHQATKEKKLFWMVGYEMTNLDELQRSIAKDDVQVNLLLRVVKNSRGKLTASSEMTAYDFPACLDDVLSPDDWTIAVLNDKVIFPRVEKKPTLLTINKNDKPITKPPIDLSRTDLGQAPKPIPVTTPEVLPVLEERSQLSTEDNTFWVRRDDAQRVNRILLKWVDISAQNSSEHLRWSVEMLSSTGFNVVRNKKTIFSFDVTTREITSPLNLKQIKEEIESMTSEALKTHPERLDNHELARHLFLRSVSFTEPSLSGFWLHMLALKKGGNDLKSNPTVRRTRRIPKF